MPRTAYYDGLNLSLKSGTGVATYARRLVETARRLGYRTGVIHSTEGRVPRDPILREIMLFDERPDGPIGRAKRIRRWIKRSVGAPLGLSPAAIPLGGTVLTRSVHNRIGEADTVFAVEDLFGVAKQHFRSYGSLVDLSFDPAPDILHCTFPLPLKARRAAHLYTIHDLVPLRLPFLTEDDKRYHYRLLKALVRHADHIVTVSEASRRDIIALLGVEETRVTNTYQAVDVPAELRTKPPEVAAAEIAGVFSVEWKSFFLFVGALEPKKNVARLVESYLASGAAMPLLVVGPSGWRSDYEQQLIDDERFGYYAMQEGRFTYRRRVSRVGYVPYPLLVSLMRGARAVLFPSLYEGFGLPILEAMQLGTPVITSTGGSIPEIAGDAAILIDPYDTEALRRAVAAVAVDDDLCAQLAQAGLRQARKFSPDAYRDAVRRLYETVLR